MRALLISTLFGVALLSGCAATTFPSAGDSPFCTQAGGSREWQADLLFGRDIKGHGPVTDAERAAFLADVVTPRFPDGLTYWDTHGQWRDRATGAITKEDSFVIRIAAADTPATLAHLAEIRHAYTERFHQESVGLLLSPICASF
ncbi:DUF3574 domain-containing protein [Burkholderia alba]|uniref:DUF3574 domain-containing protein n=1 Tax=Burkholderia alba TaxID=2683677 RepID=UPI002B05242B|nr:DUF3574 domain-containing protein [Burkholderia alba]